MSYAIPILSYPCHKFVRLSCSGPQMKFSRTLHCGSSFALHNVQQAQQDLFATTARADSSLPPALGWDAAGAGSCAPADPRLRGGRRRGGQLVGGSACGGPPAYGRYWSTGRCFRYSYSTHTRSAGAERLILSGEVKI